jgi:hypothetical protein
MKICLTQGKVSVTIEQGKATNEQYAYSDLTKQAIFLFERIGGKLTELKND